MPSRQERFLITRGCNWDCLFCAGHEPVGTFEPLEALKKRYGESFSEKVEELHLSGGEPTLHPDLLSFARWLKETAACERLVLETNGTAIGAQPRLPGLLKEAGVEAVHLLWLGGAPKILAALTQKTEAAEEPWQRLQAWLEKGPDLFLVIPVVAGTVQHLPRMVQAVAEKAPAIRGLLFQAIQWDRTPDVWRKAVPPPWVAAQAIGAAWELAEKLPFCLGWTGPFPFPACADSRDWMHRGWLEQREEVYQKKGVELVRWEGCGSCAMERHCGGLDPEEFQRWGTGGYEARKRVIRQTLEEQERRFRLLHPERRLVPFTSQEGGVVRATLRINGRCNHTCPFCFIDRGAPDLPPEEVFADLERLGQQKCDFVAFTGGEPTLSPHLPEYLRRARELGITVRELQTNAMKCDDPAYARLLAEAGVTTVLVSLHASFPELSDRITGYEGAWVRTVAGIDNLCETDVVVRLNYVINVVNAHHTAEFVRWYRKRFLEKPSPVAHLTLSTAQLTVGYGEEWNIPRFSDVVGPLREALQFCFSHQMAVGGMVGECGVPPCLLGLDVIPEQDREHMIASPFRAEVFRYVEACKGCAARSWCPGVRGTYLDLYGGQEFAAIVP